MISHLESPAPAGRPAGLPRPAGLSLPASGSALDRARSCVRLLLSAVLVTVGAVFCIALVLHVRGFETFAVLSGSMRPGMPVGTLVLTQPVATAEIRVGDVITFHPPRPPRRCGHPPGRRP